MTRMTLPARALRTGDYLPGSDKVVRVAPTRGVCTPAGKVEMGLERAGRVGVRAVAWGAGTTVTVMRQKASA